MMIKMFQSRGVLMSTTFFFKLSLFIKHGEGLQKVNCNIEDNNTVLLSCRSNEQIFINSIFYHQPEMECVGTGSCKSRFRTGDSNFSPVCQYKYGDCNQTLDNTVLEYMYCKTHNLSIAAEVDYDCRVNRSAKGIYSVQILGSNTSEWIADISCPQQAFIYIQSIAYWTLNSNSTCQSKVWTIPEDQLRLNHLCIKQRKCQPSLLYNITSRDGYQLEWPNLAAKLNYTCIQEAVDVCTEIVRTSNDSITTLYIKSSTALSSLSTMPSSCRCQVYGNEMGVKILYLNFSKVSSVRGDLYFTPAPDSVLNLTTPIINTTIFTNISNVTVTFDNRNLSEQYFLLEFTALKNSFLQVFCLESENDTHVSKSSTFNENKNMIVLIGGVSSAGLLIILIAIIVILIRLRKRKKKMVQSIISKTTKIPAPMYFELEDDNGETNSENDEQSNHYETVLDFSGVKSPSNISDSDGMLPGNAIPDSLDTLTHVNSASTQINLEPSDSNSHQWMQDFEILENEQYVSFDETKTEINPQSVSAEDSDFEVMENELYIPLELDTEYKSKGDKFDSSNYEQVDV